MPNFCCTQTKGNRLVLSDLRRQMADVIHQQNKEGAHKLLPAMQLFCRKVDKLRKLGDGFADLKISPYVLAVATLAGREEEFAQYA